MDTENFILRRRQVTDRLGTRRARELTAYPFILGGNSGFHLPGWARVALSFVPRGGLVTALMGSVLPLVAPFLMEKKSSILSRFLAHFTRS